MQSNSLKVIGLPQCTAIFFTDHLMLCNLSLGARTAFFKLRHRTIIQQYDLLLICQQITVQLNMRLQSQLQSSRSCAVIG